MDEDERGILLASIQASVLLVTERQRGSCEARHTAQQPPPDPLGRADPFFVRAQG
ncbi:hypothetical protein WOLCODRAFT_28845 [Wolfiporia cocos MD-104 SS10]|uniref:Uncharacterized protein n=1 Tax=Wolfiporia cocos (strain MD-104) TaxID=742152 RepID=A0A2H3J3X9_WOLCO|nr:hypothetical protein WOLCODRAFT_28845 [Wolfiporia cocos MD-104 SS10]